MKKKNRRLPCRILGKLINKTPLSALRCMPPPVLINSLGQFSMTNFFSYNVGDGALIILFVLDDVVSGVNLFIIFSYIVPKFIIHHSCSR